MNSELCIALIDQICNALSGTPPPGQNIWTWASNAGCSLGFWFPGTLYEGATTITPVTAPSFDRCSSSIFGAMIGACSQPGGNTYPSSVNLQTLPSSAGNGLPVDGGKSYISYYVANNITGLNVVQPNVGFGAF